MGLIMGVMAVTTTVSSALSNPGFETGDFTGWATFGTGWRIGAGADANSGSWGVVDDVLVTDSDIFRGVFQNMPAVAGNLYTGGAWIRAVSVGTSESYFEMEFHDTNGTILAQHQSTHVTADQAFTFMDVSYVAAPIGTVTVSVRGIVFMPGAPTDSDFHIFDDFELTEVVPPPPLLSNAGFETGSFDSWSTFGTGWRTSGGGDAFTGSFGGVNDVLTSDSDTFRGVFQNVPVTAGATYSVGTHIKAVNVESSESWLEIQWYDSGGGIISQQQGTHVTGNQTFTLSSLNELTAPAGAVTAGVRGIVYMPAAPSSDTDFHIFDDFFLLEPVDLSITIYATTNYLETGTQVSYLLTIHNGSVAASGIFTVTNNLSSNLTYVSSSDGGINNGQFVSWQLNSLAGGSFTTITVTAVQPVFNGNTQQIENVVSATVNSSVGDPNTGNNSNTTIARTVGIPMLSNVAMIILGCVLLYAFYRRHRLASGVTA